MNDQRHRDTHGRFRRRNVGDIVIDHLDGWDNTLGPSPFLQAFFGVQDPEYKPSTSIVLTAAQIREGSRAHEVSLGRRWLEVPLPSQTTRIYCGVQYDGDRGLLLFFLDVLSRDRATGESMHMIVEPVDAAFFWTGDPRLWIPVDWGAYGPVRDLVVRVGVPDSTPDHTEFRFNVAYEELQRNPFMLAEFP